MTCRRRISSLISTKKELRPRRRPALRRRHRPPARAAGLGHGPARPVRPDRRDAHEPQGRCARGCARLCLRLRCARARAGAARPVGCLGCARARMRIRGATVFARARVRKVVVAPRRRPLGFRRGRQFHLRRRLPRGGGRLSRGSRPLRTARQRRDAAPRRRLCPVSLRLSLRRAGVSSRLLCALSSLRCPSRLRASPLVSGVCLVSARLNLSSRLWIYPLSQDLKQSLGIEKPLLKKELLKAPGYVNSGCVKVLSLHMPAQWVMP